jgi:hypothetical protein
MIDRSSVALPLASLLLPHVLPHILPHILPYPWVVTETRHIHNSESKNAYIGVLNPNI